MKTSNKKSLECCVTQTSTKFERSSKDNEWCHLLTPLQWVLLSEFSPSITSRICEMKLPLVFFQ